MAPFLVFGGKLLVVCCSLHSFRLTLHAQITEWRHFF